MEIHILLLLVVGCGIGLAQRRDELVPKHEACEEGDLNCMCMSTPCHQAGYAYCSCPLHFCELGDRYCCCPTPVKQCATQSNCVCLRKGICHQNNMLYCNPSVCGRLCPPWKCCCRTTATPPTPDPTTTPAPTGPCIAGTCTCWDKKCYFLGKEYCDRGDCRKDCPKGKCCCDTKEILSPCPYDPEGCECKKKGKKTCLERGLKYCHPKSCGKKCPEKKCCCRKDDTTSVEVVNSYGCHDESSCSCFRLNCYVQGLEYCNCKGCEDPTPACCCANSQIKKCPTDECECKKGKRSCLQRGLAYCPPGACGKCPHAKCCCVGY